MVSVTTTTWPRLSGSKTLRLIVHNEAQSHWRGLRKRQEGVPKGQRSFQLRIVLHDDESYVPGQRTHTEKGKHLIRTLIDNVKLRAFAHHVIICRLFYTDRSPLRRFFGREPKPLEQASFPLSRGLCDKNKGSVNVDRWQTKLSTLQGSRNQDNVSSGSHSNVDRTLAFWIFGVTFIVRGPGN
jgi:hypothetical protein